MPLITSPSPLKLMNEGWWTADSDRHMQQTDMSGWSEDLAVPRLLYSSLVCYGKKEIFEELQPLCSERWVSTVEINISNLPAFRILKAQGSSLVSPSEPLPILVMLQTGRLSGVYFVGCLQFLARGRTYKLVHSFEGPTGFWDPHLIDHNVLSGNTSVIYTRNYQQMNCPLRSTSCDR